MPVRQPGAGEIQQQQQTEHQQPFARRQPEGAVRAGVGVADEVVQDQHGDATEQQAIDQRLVLVGGREDRRLQGDIGP
ncbi:hypothetical protein D3C71_1227820 [compost metagenome]